MTDKRYILGCVIGFMIGLLVFSSIVYSSNNDKVNAEDTVYNKINVYIPKAMEHPKTDVGTDTHHPPETIRSEITAYTAYDSGNSMTGLAADGKPAIAYRTASVDPRFIPFGSLIYVPGYKEPFVAHDTGGAIKGHKIDICVATTAEAFQWGRRTVSVIVYKKK